MRFIVSKKKEVRALFAMEEKVRMGGAEQLGHKMMSLTVFTEGPIESRRRLNVQVRVSASSDGRLVIDMVLPYEASLTFEYVPKSDVKLAHYDFHVVEEPSQIEEWIRYAERDAKEDDIRELGEIAVARSLTDHLVALAVPVPIRRGSQPPIAA